MPITKLSRRRFLQSTAAAAAAASAQPGLGAQPTIPEHAWPENGTLVPDDGWRLWVDRAAEWRNDTIFLPEDVRPGGPGALATLPVNAPTCGWNVLTDAAPGSVAVTLPSTVEQHFWGAFGAGADGKPRSYTPDEYRYAADDPVPQNGAYFGVSWWYRALVLPATMQGKRIFLHIRGAHLRAEVYLNRKLVGYSILEELPFECDLTAAAQPGGANQLAIRITNPFGRYDWVDGLNAQWGAVKLYRSHGFGGLDRGMTVSAHGTAVRIRDAFVLNTPDVKEVVAVVTVEQLRPFSAVDQADIELRVLDPVTGKALAENGFFPGELAVGEVKSFTMPLFCDDARTWSLDQPRLYHLRVGLNRATVTASGQLMGDSEATPAPENTHTVVFGFRTFAPQDVGTNGTFRFNGKRIRLYSAISWGFWGLNGMWPTPELAEKEVTQARRLNLNCLNFHRNLAKEDVLRAHDRLGLLRYMEPGAGKLAIGKPPAGPAETSGQSIAHSAVMVAPSGAADRFAQRYMLAKCVAMVRAFRSHPSVIIYCLQNELGADLNNPATLAVLKAMRDEDPSRLIVLNDGFVAPPERTAQAWYAPWDDTLHRSDREAWGGWWNQHQGAGDQWYDEFYKSPANFTYRSPEHKALSEFGEMEGCATPDNHSLLLHQHADPAGTGLGRQPANRSYDQVDHQEQLAATDAWLDRWGFRKAFPATELLWTSLGRKCYDTWQNYLENARISDDLDFAVISGWETTAIENHSGIVDNLRNFKSDPTPIAATLQPVRPVAKQRSMCTALGEAAVFDLYLLNDTSAAVSGTLRFEAVTPSGKLLRLGEFPAPAQTPDVFSYLLREGFKTPPLTEEGMYRFRFGLSSAPASTQVKEIWVAGSDRDLECRSSRPLAVIGIPARLREQLRTSFGSCYQLVDFVPGHTYAAIVSSGLTSQVNATQNSGDTTGNEVVALGPERTVTQQGRLDPAVIEAVKAGTPLLVMPQADSLSDGVAAQLAAAGAFTFSGNVGDFRAPWMGNWYFVREHAVFAGMPVNQCMGVHYQARGRQSNGLLVDGPEVEVLVGYSRDHDRRIGAGTFTCRVGLGKVLYHRVPEMHPVLQARFLANALRWLTVK